jgi:hypothetical protein
MSGHVPAPPAQGEADAAWGWADRFSEAIHARARAAQLRADILMQRCGDCSAWMTKSCPRERPGGMSGRSTGPSANDPICRSFRESARSAKLREERRAELARIEGPKERVEG